MERIKNYVKGWKTIRIIRLILGGALGIAYYYNYESLFLFAGIILTVQAIFNISCPGGSCGTNYTGENKPIIKVKKYEPNK